MGVLTFPEPTATASNQPELAGKLHFQRNAMGAVPSPFHSFLVQRGAKTLMLGMKKPGLNALAFARARSSIVGRRGEGVDWVVYPSLPGRTEESRRKKGLTWRMFSPHAPRSIAESIQRTW